MKVVDVKITVDEHWPIYDIEAPEEGVSPNCQMPEDLYKEFLKVQIEYNRMQKVLKAYYEQT